MQEDAVEDPEEGELCFFYLSNVFGINGRAADVVKGNCISSRAGFVCSVRSDVSHITCAQVS